MTQVMYKWNAEDYHQNSSEQKRFARQIISNLELKGNERILDIGCGDGQIPAEIAALVPNGSLLGIDLSEDMVEFAQQKFPAQDFPNLRFQQQDASHLNFDHEFDLVVSFTCLHWIKDHVPVLSGIKRSLKPNGKAKLLLCGKHIDESIGQKFFQRLFGLERWAKYLRNLNNDFGLYTADEYKNMLEVVNFQPYQVKTIETEMVFDGKEEFKAFIRSSWLHFMAVIPEDLHADFIDDLAQIFLDMNPPTDDGLVHLPMITLEVEAIK